MLISCRSQAEAALERVFNDPKFYHHRASVHGRVHRLGQLLVGRSPAKALGGSKTVT
jgi:hypothetical protein